MKTIRDFDLSNKKVIIRVDFNVPIENGNITDDTRIKASLETIKYAIDNNAKVILLSHLGRVKTEEDKIKNNLEPVAVRLGELLDIDIYFSTETRGKELEDAVNELKAKEVLLIQNTRYEDLDGKLESSNDSGLGKYWASLGDIFINDAFGTCHRAHASNVGIASILPSAIGFLVEKEVKILGNAINNPKRPLTVILGGSKVSDKIGVIENLVNIADNILIGGGMAYTFLKASGLDIGKSLLDEDNIEFCKKMLKEHSDSIVLPIDSINTLEIKDGCETRECFINEFKKNEIGVDIGPKTVKLFNQYLADSETIIWNGPVGIFEIDNFATGTKGILEILKTSKAIKIIGGGDTAASVNKFGYDEYMTHISTGGGASLEFLEGKELPAIKVIDEK